MKISIPNKFNSVTILRTQITRDHLDIYCEAYTASWGRAPYLVVPYAPYLVPHYPFHMPQTHRCCGFPRIWWVGRCGRTCRSSAPQTPSLLPWFSGPRARATSRTVRSYLQPHLQLPYYGILSALFWRSPFYRRRGEVSSGRGSVAWRCRPPIPTSPLAAGKHSRIRKTE